MLNFQNVYQNLTQGVADELKLLWMSEGAIAEQEAVHQRLQEVVYIIQDSESGKVAGVSTAVKKKVSFLNSNFLYEFRCYISENYRIAGLDIKISKLTIDFLQELSKGDPEKPVGVFTVLENDFLQQQSLWRRAVWPETEMYFIGFTKAGNPIRVHYFKGARI